MKKLKRQYHVGQTIRFHYTDFDGPGDAYLEVYEVHDDYIMAKNEDANFLIEAGWNEDMVVD